MNAPALPMHSLRFRCGKCHQPIPNWGRKKQLVRGASVWVGVCCKKPKTGDAGSARA